MKDGLGNSCKDCRKAIDRARYNEKMKDPEWAEKERIRSREKYKRLSHRWKKPTSERTRERRIKYKEMYPEKYEAKNKTRKMESKIKGNHLHHWSYNKEHFKDVIELTRDQHIFIHRFMTYDQERLMYRDLDGELLDTKERHLEFLDWCLKNKN